MSAATSIEAAARREPRRRTGSTPRARRRREALIAYAFLAPSAIPLTAFVLYPMAQAAWASLHDWNLITPMQWVGVDNYVALVRDPETLAAFTHTLYYIGGTLPLVFCGGLALALGLNRAMKGRNLLRGMYFLPVVTSWVAVAILWRWLLNPEVGVVNQVLAWFGVDGPGWWTDPTWSMPSIIIASAWKDLGFVMVLLLAGLQAIPEQVNEAATLDGASPWRRLRSITLPLLTPSIFFVIIITLINGFQVFDQVYAMTGGGPAGSSEVVVQRIYDLTFRFGDAGLASALSMILFLVVLIVTMIQIRGERRWVNYA
ncbi:carbohydrate ABC transporter permease [Demequina aestuarii]|uniref:carbohydrate ABC transporter permease n=1 Tax=Demequina aestuarii TaxID=327095 RepID=UPI000AE067A3|nr:sugar ABC transporter permease [Demequina aestuarii]